MSNPNPARITDQLWWFWTEFKKIEPSVRLGGIYANKPGYHNTRLGNYPTNYSVKLPDDKLGPSDKAAAIDLTFPDAQQGDYKTIRKYSYRLLKSGKDLNDERGNYLREFYGQADADTGVEGWDFQYLVNVSSDSSHLWHIHLSFIRRYVGIWKAMRAVLSILKGESVEVWRVKEAALIIQYHTVTTGDTLSGIATRYNTSVERLMVLNPSIVDEGLIYVGQRVRIR